MITFDIVNNEKQIDRMLIVFCFSIQESFNIKQLDIIKNKLIDLKNIYEKSGADVSNYLIDLISYLSDYINKIKNDKSQ